MVIPMGSKWVSVSPFFETSWEGIIFPGLNLAFASE